MNELLNNVSDTGMGRFQTIKMKMVDCLSLQAGGLLLTRHSGTLCRTLQTRYERRGGRSTLAAIFILFIFQGHVAGQKEQYENKAKRIELTSDIAGDLVDSLFFNSTRFIPLETTDRSLLRRISRIYMDDGKLFVFDKSLNKIAIFSMDGKYLTDIHRVGNGPSEYAGSMDFCLDTNQKQILLLCDRPYKIMRFNYSGEFVDEKSIDDFYFNFIAHPGGFFCCSRLEIAATHTDGHELVYLDTNLNTSRKDLAMRKALKSTRFFVGNTLTHTLNSHYTRRLDNTIYQIKADGVVSEYKIDFKKYALPSRMKDDYVKNESSSNPGAKYILSITEVSENKKFIFFNTNLGIFVYNKQTDILKGFKAIQCSKIKVSGNSFYSVGNSNTTVASILSAVYLSQAKENKNQYKDYDNYELLELAKDIELEDNPVLVLYEYNGD